MHMYVHDMQHDTLIWRCTTGNKNNIYTVETTTVLLFYDVCWKTAKQVHVQTAYTTTQCIKRLVQYAAWLNF